MREGIEQILRAEALTVVASLGDAVGLVPIVESRLVDAVVLDIRMPPTKTDEGLRDLEDRRARGSSVGVLLLSQYVTPAYALRAVAAGPGTGYLMKERIATGDVLARAVRTVASGGSVVDPDVVAMLVAQRRSVDTLTERERDVLAVLRHLDGS